PPHLRRSQDRDHERQERCGNQSDWTDQVGEGENGDNDERRTTNFVLFNRRSFGKGAADRNGGTEGGKYKQEQPRAGAGAESETALAGQVGRSDQGERREHDEGYAAIEIPRTVNGQDTNGRGDADQNQGR